jgi:hypothetical protein
LFFLGLGWLLLLLLGASLVLLVCFWLLLVAGQGRGSLLLF